MLALTLTAALAATPSVVVLPFESAGLEPSVVAGWVDRFSLLLAEGQQVKVLSRQDLSALIGVERQKQLLGCQAEASCMAEIAAGLGAEGVLRGSVVRSGSSVIVTARLLRSKDGSAWLDATTRVSTDDAALEFLEDTAVSFRTRLAPAPAPRPASWYRWLPAVGGALLGGGAAACFAQSLEARARLKDDPSLAPDDVFRLRRDGQAQELAGALLAGAAVAAVSASVAWAVLGARADAPATLSVAPTRDGALLSFALRF